MQTAATGGISHEHTCQLHPPRPALAGHPGQAHPGPRRLCDVPGRHLLLVWGKQGKNRRQKRHLALGRAVLRLRRLVQLGGQGTYHPPGARGPQLLPAPQRQHGQAPHPLQPAHEKVCLLAENHEPGQDPDGDRADGGPHSGPLHQGAGGPAPPGHERRGLRPGGGPGRQGLLLF